MKYKVNLYGYGGEFVVGSITKEVYEYFTDNDIDLAEYSTNDETTVPKEFQPFEPGSWYELDNIFHEYGVNVGLGSFIEVVNETGDVVFENSLEVFSLKEIGINVIFHVSNLDFHTNEYRYVAESSEKGLFFSAELETETFDPTKLSIFVDSFDICSGVTYNDEDLDNQDGDTRGKGMSFGMFAPGEEIILY